MCVSFIEESLVPLLFFPLKWGAGMWSMCLLLYHQPLLLIFTIPALCIQNMSRFDLFIVS